MSETLSKKYSAACRSYVARCAHAVQNPHTHVGVWTKQNGLYFKPKDVIDNHWTAVVVGMVEKKYWIKLWKGAPGNTNPAEK